MPRRKLGIDVFSAALDRIEHLYREGHKVVVSMSGGKDSTVCLELAILAATNTGKLPVHVVSRDEEIMFPGTYEYLERVAERPEVDMHWLLAYQPIINIFNRSLPYFWVFDPQLPPEQWVRQPPSYAYAIPELTIHAMTTLERFPPDEGKNLYSITGLRTQESPNRRMSIHNTKGYLTKNKTKRGAYVARPIYDWKDNDVWKAIKDMQWDYNEAYNVMYRMGVPRQKMRIGPPTMSAAAIALLSTASRAWPRWFDKVCNRLPGVRTGAKFGRAAVTPHRKLGESWEDCYNRACLGPDSPLWIQERAQILKDHLIAMHGRHSTAAFPDLKPCLPCGQVNTWRQATNVMYNGDPFVTQASSCSALKYVEPEFFRSGAGYWGGTPSF